MLMRFDSRKKAGAATILNPRSSAGNASDPAVPGSAFRRQPPTKTSQEQDDDVMTPVLPPRYSQDATFSARRNEPVLDRGGERMCAQECAGVKALCARIPIYIWAKTAI